MIGSKTTNLGAILGTNLGIILGTNLGVNLDANSNGRNEHAIWCQVLRRPLNPIHALKYTKFQCKWFVLLLCFLLHSNIKPSVTRG
jgi:hypothetical protein